MPYTQVISLWLSNGECFLSQLLISASQISFSNELSTGLASMAVIISISMPYTQVISLWLSNGECFLSQISSVVRTCQKLLYLTYVPEAFIFDLWSLVHQLLVHQTDCIAFLHLIIYITQNEHKEMV